MDDETRKTNADDDVEIDETDEEGTPQDLVKRLRERLAKAAKEKQEYLDGWQRLRADFLNYKKRMEDEVKGATTKGRLDVIGDMLQAIESFDMAMGNKEAWEKVEKNWRIGVEYIYQQLISGLEGHGLKAIVPKVGEPFDSNRDAAVESVHTDDPAKDHTIAEVVQKGYEVDGYQLRPPKVKVYSKGGP